MVLLHYYCELFSTQALPSPPCPLDFVTTLLLKTPKTRGNCHYMFAVATFSALAVASATRKIALESDRHASLVFTAGRFALMDDPSQQQHAQPSLCRRRPSFHVHAHPYIYAFLRHALSSHQRCHQESSYQSAKKMLNRWNSAERRFPLERIHSDLKLHDSPRRFCFETADAEDLSVISWSCEIIPPAAEPPPFCCPGEYGGFNETDALEAEAAQHKGGDEKIVVRGRGRRTTVDFLRERPATEPTKS